MFPFEVPVPEPVKDTINKAIAGHRVQLLEGVIEAIQPEIDRAWSPLLMGLQARDIELEFPRGYRGR